MNTKLLEVSSRRLSVAPELVRYFAGENVGVESFLRAFGGTTIQVPGPELWDDLRRDHQIVQSLQRDSGVSNRIALLRANRGVRYAHMAECYRLVVGRDLPAPEVASKEDKMRQAVGWMVQQWGLADDIGLMFSLLPIELRRAKAEANAKRKAKKA